MYTCLLSSVKVASPLDAGASWWEPDGLSVEEGILQAVAYADVFDYPLTAEEVHRYLVGVPASLATVREVLHNGSLVPRYLVRHQRFFSLPGREGTVETRRRRAEVACQKWPRAAYYGRIIAGLPFVRMVAVTGALAVDNVEPDADIDYLIVTEPGRLWLCRALVIGVVHLAARRGDVLCPNYFLSEQALALEERNLFTAHELVQMVPVTGLDVYHRMRQLNTWAHRFLPNALGPPRWMDISVAPWPRARAAAEAALRTSIGTWLERWEMNRKVRKFSRQNGGTVEVAFCAHWCKGHFDNHGQRTLKAFQERLRALELG